MSKQIEAVNALRAMNAEELDDHLHEQRRKLFEVRFQQAAGQVDNHRQIRELRREIARTMTVQVEVAHGHRLASEAVLESGMSEPEDQPRRRRLFRRGGEPAAARGVETERGASASEALGGEAQEEAPEAAWGGDAAGGLEAAAEAPEAEEEMAESAEDDDAEAGDGDREGPEAAASEGGSEAATENQ